MTKGIKEKAMGCSSEQKLLLGKGGFSADKIQGQPKSFQSKLRHDD